MSTGGIVSNIPKNSSSNMPENIGTLRQGQHPKVEIEISGIDDGLSDDSLLSGREEAVSEEHWKASFQPIRRPEPVCHLSSERLREIMREGRPGVET